jgi:hypothetical protein
MLVFGVKQRSTNYSRLMSQVLNVVFYDLFPALLAVKALLTLWYLLPSMQG